MQPKDRRLVTERNLETYTESKVTPLLDSVETASRSSQQAVTTAQQADSKSDNAISRVEAIETVAGLAPGEVTDAQTANLLQQPNSSTRAAFGATLADEVNEETSTGRTAVDAAIHAQVEPAMKNIRALVSQRIPATITPRPELELFSPVTITRDADGNYTADLDPESRHIPNQYPTYYVDPAIGKDLEANGGSWAAPYATPNYPFAKHQGQYAELVIKGGIYARQELTASLVNGLTLRAAEGTRPVFVAGDRLTWTSTGNHYEGVVTGPTGVLDARDYETTGEPRKLGLVGSIAEVDDTPGTYYAAEGRIYVHLHDGGQPNDRVFALRAVNSLSYHPSYATGDYGTTYLEGIEFWGGTTANLTPPGVGWKFLAKDCAWKYATGSNGLSVIGVAETLLVSCEASYNRFDGFNYHNHGDGRTGLVIEVDCRGLHNGTVEGSQNGSTTHETYRVLRVGGNYTNNLGANIADVNETISHNVGVTAGGDLGYSEAFLTNGDSAMWVDSVTATSDTSLLTRDNATLYRRDTIATGAVEGNVQDY